MQMDPITDVLNVATYFTTVLAPYRLLGSHPVAWAVGVSIYLTRLCLALLAPRAWCAGQLDRLASMPLCL